MEEIFFCLERMYHGFTLRGYVFDKDNELVFSVPADGTEVSDREGSLLISDTLLKEFRNQYAKIQAPYISIDKKGVYFISFVDLSDRLIVIGPAAIDQLSFEQDHEFRKTYHMKNESFKISVLPITLGLNVVAILFEQVNGIQLTDGEIFRKNNMVEHTEDKDVVKYEYSRELEEKHRFSYAVEQKWVSDIENGIFDSRNIEFSPENMDLLSQIGLLSDNSFKQMEYMVVTAITLASRAAMRAGISTYEAYMVSDLYYQKVSRAKNIMELLHIYIEVANDYSDRVKKSKENKSADYVERVLDYVARHRTHKISVSEISKEVGLSVGYLSRKFTEEMGITLQEYILKQRLMAGANMLEYSDLTVGEISEYLSFSSQSYFGERFREEYGVTPRQYRNVHKIIDFQTKQEI